MQNHYTLKNTHMHSISKIKTCVFTALYNSHTLLTYFIFLRKSFYCYTYTIWLVIMIKKSYSMPQFTFLYNSIYNIVISCMSISVYHIYLCTSVYHISVIMYVYMSMYMHTHGKCQMYTKL